jgi:hypothetical protein
MPANIAARAAATLMVGIALFHALLVLGAPWGDFTQAGRRSGSLDAVGRAVAAASLVLLLVMAAVILSRVREGPLKHWRGRFVSSLAWLTTAYAGLAVILNLITPSFRERAVFAPVSLVLLVLVVTAMVSTRRSE